MQLVLVAGEARDVGKTTLGERLVARLVARGLRVAVVKHVHHGVDYRVKDTGRYLAAGAELVAAVGPGEYMVVRRARLGFAEALRLAAGADVVLVEGFKEHLAEALGMGGCAAYVRRGGIVALHAPGGGEESLDLDAAVVRLASLVLSGGCTAGGEEASKGAEEAGAAGPSCAQEH